MNLPISVPLQNGYISITHDTSLVYFLINREKNYISLFENIDQIKLFKDGEQIF